MIYYEFLLVTRIYSLMLLCQLAFQAQTGPAFADNLHLITKKANDSTKCTGSIPDNMRQDTYTQQ